MSFNVGDFPEVRWHVIPLHTPRVLRHCATCGTVRRFASSDRFRLNCQQVTVDVWLVYKCIECDGTWNCAIIERCPVKSIAPRRYRLFERNDKDLAWSYAFDYRVLAGAGVHVDTTFEVRVESSESGLDGHMDRSRIIVIELSHPGIIRLDRLVAQQLRISRASVEELYDKGQLRIYPDLKNALRKTAHSGQRILLAKALSKYPA